MASRDIDPKINININLNLKDQKISARKIQNEVVLRQTDKQLHKISVPNPNYIDQEQCSGNISLIENYKNTIQECKLQFAKPSFRNSKTNILKKQKKTDGLHQLEVSFVYQTERIKKIEDSPDRHKLQRNRIRASVYQKYVEKRFKKQKQNQQNLTSKKNSTTANKKTNKKQSRSMSAKKSRLSSIQDQKSRQYKKSSDRLKPPQQNMIKRKSFSGRLPKKNIQATKSKELKKIKDTAPSSDKKHSSFKKAGRILFINDQSSNKKDKRNIQNKQKGKKLKIKKGLQKSQSNRKGSSKKKIVKKKKDEGEVVYSQKQKYGNRLLNYGQQQMQRNEYQQLNIYDYGKMPQQIIGEIMQFKNIGVVNIKYSLQTIGKYIHGYLNRVQLKKKSIQVDREIKGYWQSDSKISIQQISQSYQGQPNSSGQQQGDQCQYSSNNVDAYRIIQEQQRTRQLKKLIEEMADLNVPNNKIILKKINHYLQERYQENRKVIIQNMVLKQDLKQYKKQNCRKFKQQQELKQSDQIKFKMPQRVVQQQRNISEQYPHQQQDAQNIKDQVDNKRRQIEMLKDFKYSQVMKRLNNRQEEKERIGNKLNQKINLQDLPQDKSLQIQEKQVEQFHLLSQKKQNPYQMLQIINVRQSKLQQNHKAQLNIIHKMLNQKIMSPKTFQNNKINLQGWIHKQKQQIRTTKKNILKGVQSYQDSLKKIQRQSQLSKKMIELQQNGQWEEVNKIINLNLFKSQSSSQFFGQSVQEVSQKHEKVNKQLYKQAVYDKNQIKVLDQYQIFNNSSKQSNKILFDESPKAQQKANFLNYFSEEQMKESHNEKFKNIFNDQEQQQKVSNSNYELYAQREVDLMTNEIINLLNVQGQQQKEQVQEQQQKKQQRIYFPFQTSLNFVKEYCIAYSEFIRNHYCQNFLHDLNSSIALSHYKTFNQFHLDQNGEYQSIENLKQNPTYPYIYYLYKKQPIIKNYYFEQFNQQYTKLKRHQIQVTQETKALELYHLQLLHDIFNQSLDQERPFGPKGQSFPWKIRSKVVLKNFPHRIPPEADENQLRQHLDRLFGVSIARIIKIGSFLCGFIPETIQPGAQQQVSQSYLAHIKQSRLAMMLQAMINEQQQNWLVYDLEQAEVETQLANLLFEQLIEQSIIQLKRKNIKRNLII